MDFIYENINLFLPSLAFLGGIILQCISLLRKGPSNRKKIIFAGMFLYISAMMFYSATQGGNAQKSQILISIITSLGFVTAFLFIALFIKEVVKIINESIIISNTLSYFFLIFEMHSSLSPQALSFLTILGISMGIVSIYLIINKNKIINLYKYLFYGWYLFINGFFAISYFQNLNIEYYEISSLVLAGKIPILSMWILGMIVVHLLFNFGILYYTTIYSLLSKDTRKEIVNYSNNLFLDKQVNLKEITIMLLFQLISFIFSWIFLDSIAGEIIALWILLTPIILKIFSSLIKIPKKQ